MVDLSIIILSYNTKEITRNCLLSLNKFIDNDKIEIIVVDNGSSDSSKEMLQQTKNIKAILNGTNIGYPKGNNQGLTFARGRYVLFLNSDTLVNNIDFENIIDYLDRNLEIGALTVKVSLDNNNIDLASHRGFPTIWNAFCYFSKLEKVLGKIPFLGYLFGGYHLSYKDLNKIHEIDSPTGAFFFARKDLLLKLKGFDEDFFMYGEDLDLSYRIKENKYKIIYYPLYEVIHLKYRSGLNKKGPSNITARKHFYESMKIFYRKHYANNNFSFVNKLVYFFIDLKSKVS